MLLDGCLRIENGIAGFLLRNISNRKTDVWTRCVTLLWLTVCGLTLHACAADPGHDEPASGASHGTIWRLSDPEKVWGAGPAPIEVRRSSHAAAGEARRRIANCTSQVANCRCGLEPTAGFDVDAVALSASSAASVNKLTAGDDVRGFLPGVWRDARGIVRTENLLILGTALGTAVGIRQDLDDEVRDETAAHPDRWGEASSFLGHLGEAQYQVPILGLLWGTSLWTADQELNSLSHTLFSAYTINGLSVLAIKGITNTDRPDKDWNGGQWGFPSFHAASSFTIAGVLEEYYGWRAGVPAYTLATLISWSRIDERDHDLSDVVFGAALGWVIGKSVARQHLGEDGRVVLLPWSHPYERANGVMLEVRY